jgi:predicted nucleic-acid-binding protein
MKLLDTNAALRFLLRDVPDQFEESRTFISENEVLLRYEVLAEIAYVLNKIYGKSRLEVAEKITALVKLNNVLIQHPVVMATALKLYVEKNLDFVDCMLVAFNHVNGYAVFTFDKKMNALLR